MLSNVRGVTLVELVLAIAILGVGVAGVLSAFMTASAGSADPLIRKQMLAIAEQMMEEITLQPFAAAPPAFTHVPGPCGSREAFNDVLDYNGLQTTTGICDSSGTPLPRLARYNVGVSIDTTAALQTVSGSGNIGGGDVYQILVTVTHGDESLQLRGWRTHYANGLPE